MDSDIFNAFMDRAEEQDNQLDVEINRLLAEMESMSPKDRAARCAEVRERMMALMQRRANLGERVRRTWAALDEFGDKTKTPN